jgi:hypothetical protein
MEEARHLSSKRTLASEEFLLKDDNPMLKQNLTALLWKIMQEDSSTWDALRFLDQMKASNPGLDYRVKCDHYARPEAVCWMLPEMHSDLIRFGNCLFLESQKRQYNVVGWPYIGAVVKDLEMQVRCVAECICLEESHRMYVWIVSMLADMEPRYNLNFLNLIFGDQGLTQNILVDLDIATTCILRCDYYHQIHEVWPHTFGTHLFEKIRGHLDQMLLGSKEEWDLSYPSAKSFLLHDAKKFSALERIHKNPSHFAGWFLKTIEGNFFIHGSVPAEQNHSSVAAHLGSGVSWSVVVRVLKLLDRQRHLTKKRRDKEGRAHVVSFDYMSNLQDQAGLDDETAKKQLSQYAYNKLWLVEYKTNRRLQFVTRDDVTIVWPNGKPHTCDEHVLINSGQRCSCLRRIAFSRQGCHELCTDGKLDLAKYSPHWLNHTSFNETVTSFNLQLPPAETVTNSLSTARHHPTPAARDDDPPFPNNFSDDTYNSAHEESEDAAVGRNPEQ